MPGPTACHGRDPVTVALEIVAEQCADFPIVVDDE